MDAGICDPNILNKFNEIIGKCRIHPRIKFYCLTRAEFSEEEEYQYYKQFDFSHILIIANLEQEEPDLASVLLYKCFQNQGKSYGYVVFINTYPEYQVLGLNNLLNILFIFLAKATGIDYIISSTISKESEFIFKEQLFFNEIELSSIENVTYNFILDLSDQKKIDKITEKFKRLMSSQYIKKNVPRGQCNQVNL